MATAEGRDASPPPPGGAEEYVRDSIEASLGLPIPERLLRLKLAASEDHVFALEEELHAAARRIDLLRNESAMNAEEKKAMAAARNQLAVHAASLERKCGLYEHKLEGDREACYELRKVVTAVYNEMEALLRDKEIPRTNLNKAEEEVTALNNEVESLQRDKEILRTNLNKAEEEVTALNNEVEALQRDKEILRTNLNKAEEEVKLLVEENKRLLCLLEKGQKYRSRQPLSPLQPNSPDCRVHKE